ncbi:PEP-CTERM sorting domain-containing protein [Thalassotalea hakodatensis]|uniref:PEP-CTERM sorting domain-containing protein n=1 Tax=Thalassotalea hakodatensis TaxID=3030492 RepID=UPI0025742A26|nr:PEP-CTERM sorting domain-containing protein [Thalassotalea hakodatensis]
MKSFFSLILLSICLTSASQATLITNLTQSELDSHDYTNAVDQLSSASENIHYVSANGWDYAWVSPVNAETWGTNTLYAPEVQQNWTYATLEQLVFIHQVLTLDAFTIKDAQGNATGYIHAVEYFNSVFTGLNQNILDQDVVTTSDFLIGIIASERNEAGLIPFYLDFADTFYVRESLVDTPSADVPEPASLLLIALGLVFIVSRKLVRY